MAHTVSHRPQLGSLVGLGHSLPTGVSDRLLRPCAHWPRRESSTYTPQWRGFRAPTLSREAVIDWRRRVSLPCLPRCYLNRLCHQAVANCLMVAVVPLSFGPVNLSPTAEGVLERVSRLVATTGRYWDIVHGGTPDFGFLSTSVSLL